MINPDWITASVTTLLSIVVSALGIYAALLVLTRLSGLRSFSQMSSFDFAITVATGSVLASTITSKSPALFAGVATLAVLFAIQYAVAKSRRLNSTVEKLVDNEPMVLMVGTRVLDANLDAARITNDDLNSKLRMAGITHCNQVLAVILETTGNFTVLKRSDDIDPTLFADVRDGDQVIAAFAN